MNYVIFVDGASKGNPGPGGWGSLIVLGDTVIELGGREANTTNNRMELQAAIAGLTAVNVHDAESITVYADSKYVIDGITKWVFGWQKTGWKTSLGKPVLNEELWKKLLELALSAGKKLKWNYVGGHVGVAGNERADEIASGFAMNEPVALYNGSFAGYNIDVFNLTENEDLNSSKSSARARSSAKAYSYISEVDGVVQTHKTWSECEARVRGQKARYRKALSAEEEKEIIKKFSK